MQRHSLSIRSLFILVVVMAALETIGMTMLTSHSRRSNLMYMTIGWLIYGFMIPWLLLWALQYEGIATVNLLWNIITTLTMIVIGYYVFRERVTCMHLLSFLFAIAALVTLYLATHDR